MASSWKKAMGLRESFIACNIITLLGIFLRQHKIGALTGEQGPMRLEPRLVRMPDIAFFRREKLPNQQIPTDPIPTLTPDLAVEVLSEGNTRGEMVRKRREFFLAGTELAVDGGSGTGGTVTVFTAPDQSTVFTEEDTLDGGKVLPGLVLPVKEIFEDVPVVARKPRKKKPSASPRKRRMATPPDKSTRCGCLLKPRGGNPWACPYSHHRNISSPPPPTFPLFPIFSLHACAICTICVQIAR